MMIMWLKMLANRKSVCWNPTDGWNTLLTTIGLFRTIGETLLDEDTFIFENLLDLPC